MSLSCATALRLLAELGNVPLSPLSFVVVGLNHQTAPVEVRERVAVRRGQEDVVLSHLAAAADEVMLLATCNRTEVYFAGVKGDPRRAFERAWDQELGDYLYIYQGDEAVAHLYRVAAGLNSLVIGETQIQGQVKRAWQEANERHLAGTLLNKIAQGALAAGKRVRYETGLSDKVVSVSSAAVELAQAALGNLAHHTALIIGAGETAELTLTHLKAAGVQDIIVVNRTAERAQALADKLGGRTCPAEELYAALPEADVVIASSGAPHYVLHASDVEKALQGRPQRPMFLIDISVPRILNPDISGVQNAYLYNLDDLTAIVSRNMQSRRAALPQSEAIIREATSELLRWYLTREAQLARRRVMDMASD